MALSLTSSKLLKSAFILSVVSATVSLIFDILAMNLSMASCDGFMLDGNEANTSLIASTSKSPPLKLRTSLSSLTSSFTFWT